MGLIGRQRRANEAEGNLDPIDPVHQGRFIARPLSRGSSRSTSYDLHSSPASTPIITPETPWNMPSYFNLPPTSSGIFDTGRRVSIAREVGDDGISSSFGNLNLSDSRQHSRATSDDEDASSDSMSAASGLGFHHLNASNSDLNRQRVVQRHSTSRGSAASMQPPAMALFDPNDTTRKFVGTPDYLAPETIDGSGQDGMVDWWAIGCILFEFLYGYPPFHDESPEKVFENILARRIDWPEVDEGEDVSCSAKDIMNKLMCLDSTKRLGAGGASEVKNHSFFADINWDTLFEDDTPFIPAPEHPEDTDYFDSRGLTGTLPDFPEEDTSDDPSKLHTHEERDKEPFGLLRTKTESSILKRGGLLPLSIPPHVREHSRRRDRRSSDPPNEMDFGSFTFKNLPVLEKANKDTIERLRAENASLGSPSSPSSSLPPTSVLKLSRQKSISTPVGKNRPVSSPSASSSGSGSFFSFNSPPAGISNVSMPTPPLSRSSALSSSYGSDQYPVNPFPPLTFPPKFRKPSALLPSAMRDDGSETSSRRGSRSVGSNNSAQNSPVQAEHSSVVKQRSADPLSSDPHQRRNTMPPRMRAASVSSAGLSIKPQFPEMWKAPSRRRSQVFENSPSSSDTEESKGNALLRVNQRRENTRRQSIMNLNVGPRYRPLDVLGISHQKIRADNSVRG
jgi:serine/threonine-protein kinase RIM15